MSPSVGPNPGTNPLLELLAGPGAGSPKALVELLPALRKQLAAAEARARQALAEVEGLRLVVSGVEAMANGTEPLAALPLFVEPANPGTEDGPRGREAIALILRENPEREWTTPELAREIRRRGWIKPGAKNEAVRIAARRLADDGVALKLGPGRYRLNPESGDG